MVTLAIDAAVACVCLTFMVSLRWWLSFQKAKLEHQPLAEMEQRLKDVEARLRGLHIAQGTGRSIRAG